MRKQAVFLAIRRALSRASRTWFRVLHFSVQSDHVHLLVEAVEKKALGRGVAGMAIRVARAVNRLLRRRGRFWADRYHARPLRTPREVRHAIVYVLANRRKHVPGPLAPIPEAQDGPRFDPCSSAFWFEGWASQPRLETDWDGPDPPVVRPRTWLARKGWMRHGRLSWDERPASSRARVVAAVPSGTR